MIFKIIRILLLGKMWININISTITLININIWLGISEMREIPENPNPILFVISVLSHINLAIAEIQGGGLISYTLQLFEPEKQCNENL